MHEQLPKIFINYRRDDSIAVAGRIYDGLKTAFGEQNIFMDVDTIPKGVDFAAYIDEKLAQGDLMLALIGRGWLESRKKKSWPRRSGRRIDDPRDWVRTEIEIALARGIPIIPILIDGQEMPSPNVLPAQIRQLANRNAIELRNAQFATDLPRLVAAIRETMSSGVASRSADAAIAIRKPERTRSRKALMVAGAVAVLAPAAVWITGLDSLKATLDTLGSTQTFSSRQAELEKLPTSGAAADAFSPIPTSEIVRRARCEIKRALYEMIRTALVVRGLDDIAPETALDPANTKRLRDADPSLLAKINAYGATAVAYQFDFSAGEFTDIGSAFEGQSLLGDWLPFARKTLNLGKIADLAKRREGKLVINGAETMSGLARLDCRGLEPETTESFGVSRVFSTFVELSEVGGGGRQRFTDTLVFLTAIDGQGTARLVPTDALRSRRLFSDDPLFANGLVAVHNVAVSLAFPDVDLRVVGGKRTPSIGPPPTERAMENLCIARALDRQGPSGGPAPETFCRKQ